MDAVLASSVSASDAIALDPLAAARAVDRPPLLAASSASGPAADLTTPERRSPALVAPLPPPALGTAAVRPAGEALVSLVDQALRANGNGHEPGTTSGLASAHDAHDVHVFWDMENCAPKLHAIPAVISRLRLSLAPFGRLAQIRCYADVATMPKGARVDLSQQGVTVVDVPWNRRKETADKVLLVDLVLLSLGASARGSTLVLMSGDGDFTYALAQMRNMGCRVVVVRPFSNSGSRVLDMHADHVLSWERIKTDGAHDGQPDEASAAIAPSGSSREQSPDGKIDVRVSPSGIRVLGFRGGDDEEVPFDALARVVRSFQAQQPAVLQPTVPQVMHRFLRLYPLLHRNLFSVRLLAEYLNEALAAGVVTMHEASASTTGAAASDTDNESDSASWHSALKAHASSHAEALALEGWLTESFSHHFAQQQAFAYQREPGDAQREPDGADRAVADADESSALDVQSTLPWLSLGPAAFGASSSSVVGGDAALDATLTHASPDIPTETSNRRDRTYAFVMSKRENFTSKPEFPLLARLTQLLGGSDVELARVGDALARTLPTWRHVMRLHKLLIWVDLSETECLVDVRRMRLSNMLSTQADTGTRLNKRGQLLVPVGPHSLPAELEARAQRAVAEMSATTPLGRAESPAEDGESAGAGASAGGRDACTSGDESGEACGDDGATNLARAIEPPVAEPPTTEPVTLAMATATPIAESSTPSGRRRPRRRAGRAGGDAEREAAASMLTPAPVRALNPSPAAATLASASDDASPPSAAVAAPVAAAATTAGAASAVVASPAAVAAGATPGTPPAPAAPAAAAAHAASATAAASARCLSAPRLDLAALIGTRMHLQHAEHAPLVALRSQPARRARVGVSTMRPLESLSFNSDSGLSLARMRAKRVIEFRAPPRVDRSLPMVDLARVAVRGGSAERVRAAHAADTGLAGARHERYASPLRGLASDRGWAARADSQSPGRREARTTSLVEAMREQAHAEAQARLDGIAAVHSQQQSTYLNHERWLARETSPEQLSDALLAPGLEPQPDVYGDAAAARTRGFVLRPSTPTTDPSIGTFATSRSPPRGAPAFEPGTSKSPLFRSWYGAAERRKQRASLSPISLDRPPSF